MSYNKRTGMWEGFIYVITNNLNSKKYIGQTAIDVENRWNKHIRTSKTNKCNLYLYTAMQKYGTDNFSIETIKFVQEPTKSDLIYKLNELEVKYIKLYCTLKPNGYNMSIGGNNLPNTWNKKIVYQYDVDCSFIKKYDSIAEASRQNNIQQSDISKSCKHIINRAGNYIWRFENDVPTKRIMSKLNGVKQFDFYGNLIKIWDSIENAASNLNYEAEYIVSSILSCCNGKVMQCYSFVWRFMEDSFSRYKTPKIKNKILQYSIDMELINEYSNIINAAKELHLDASYISKVLNNKAKTCGGYIWKYA